MEFIPPYFFNFQLKTSTLSPDFHHTHRNKEYNTRHYMDNYGWWSLVPPLMAIALAFLTREVLISLTAGIVSGGVIYAIGSGGTVLDAPAIILQTMNAHLSAEAKIFP